MSTFDGLVDEFPEIRIDHFRLHRARKQPAACFLSHVHSDHLTGLDSLKMPFVYCSAATKQILLRMEKYSHRVNLQKGILEARKLTYKHLKSVLRPLPLYTPIELELGPKASIRVTLFDANHCPGAVMFLIEGNGKSILYTGDVRAEPWWVDSVARSPILLPYVCGQRRLDCVYLDTTFASHHNIYKDFPTKAQGLGELLNKIRGCVRPAVFYFRAWTLGYEDVWVALASFLESRIHVDEYQIGLFSGLSALNIDPGPALAGVQVGHRFQDGCLSRHSDLAIHSCEPGMQCHARIARDPDTVWITPIISRREDGTELAELGAGGGSGDLYPGAQLEIEGPAALEALRIYCKSLIDDLAKLQRIDAIFDRAVNSSNYKISLQGLDLDHDQEMNVTQFFKLLSAQGTTDNISDASHGDKQRTIKFPYSRHSSFSELRYLLSIFRPRDVCPCTVDLDNWNEQMSMQSLFGDLCIGKVFVHDRRTRDKLGTSRDHSKPIIAPTNTEKILSTSASSDDMDVSEVIALPKEESVEIGAGGDETRMFTNDDMCVSTKNDGNPEITTRLDISLSPVDSTLQDHAFAAYDVDDDTSLGMCSPDTKRRLNARKKAYHAAKACLSDSNDHSAWDELHLRSLGWKGHTEEEIVL